jgi:2-methylcitrate dehydratase
MVVNESTGMGVAQKLAEEVIRFKFEDIPPEVLLQTKRLVLDTIGCAMGGYSSQASAAMQKVILDLGGAEEATVVGSGLRSSCLNATLANGVMVRCLDYNDAVVMETETGYRMGYHPSEVIPGILALAEKKHLTGKDVITAIVLGYDLSYRFLEAVHEPEMERRGWCGDTRGAYMMPLVAGKLLGLNATQIANAMGISASCHAVLGILDAESEDYTMTKNLRFASMAHGGILAAMMAQKGFTGPTRVIEGQHGFMELILKGEFDLAKLTNPNTRFTVLGSSIKSVVADYSTHGHVTATLTLAKEHYINPEEIAQVRVRTSTRCARHTGDPIKKYPKNREAADHSSYYLTAITILDRQLGPDQFSPEKYSDPRVHHLIEKIVFEGDKAIDKIFFCGGSSEIIMKDGKRYYCEVQYPKGHPQNPMTDEEIIAKFKSMAGKYMGEKQMGDIVTAVFDLDKLEHIGGLSTLMTFRQENG